MQPLIKLIILFLFQDVFTSWQVTLEIQDDTIYSKGYIWDLLILKNPKNNIIEKLTSQ
jgi:hypothetical protein